MFLAYFTFTPSAICLNPSFTWISFFTDQSFLPCNYSRCLLFVWHITPLGGCKVPRRTVRSCFTGLYPRCKTLRHTTYRVYTWSIAEINRDIEESQISETETWKQLSRSNQYKRMNLSEWAAECFSCKTIKRLLWLIWCDTHTHTHNLLNMIRQQMTNNI